MNTRAIAKRIEKVVVEYLESVEDEQLRMQMADGIIVAGGAIASLLLDKSPSDYDIYFSSKALAKKVCRYYIERWKEENKAVENKIGYKSEIYLLDGDVEKCGDIEKQLGAQGGWNWGSTMLGGFSPERLKIVIRSDGVWEEGEEEKPGYTEAVDALDETPISEEKKSSKKKPKERFKLRLITTNAISLSDRIQIIYRFHGGPSEILSNFDFVHCTCYWTKREGVVVNEKALESLLTGELRYHGSKYPLCSIFRVRKFLKRGYWIGAGQLLKVMFEVNRLDLNDPVVLEDQLVGVDTMYFMALLEMLKKEEAMKEGKVDISYVMWAIDKVFG